MGLWWAEGGWGDQQVEFGRPSKDLAFILDQTERKTVAQYGAHVGCGIGWLFSGSLNMSNLEHRPLVILLPPAPPNRSPGPLPSQAGWYYFSPSVAAFLKSMLSY